jgi:ArsR family transcriptional regulator
MTYQEYAELFKALSDETRVQVVMMLTTEKQCACQILERFKISQPTLSHHMRILTNAKLVSMERKGKWVHYAINPHTFAQIQTFIDSIGKRACACTVCDEAK